jgi:uncharacterized protein (DUF58 family)
VRRLLYKSFRLTYAVEAWFVRRFTPAGRLVAAGLAATAVVGIDTNRTLAYQAFAFLVALLAVALGSSFFFRGRFAVERRLPRYGTAGEPLPYRLSVENLTERLHAGLVVVEALADPRPTIEELRDSREPGEERRNWFDRTVGYPRWSWLIAQNRQADAREVALPPLSPRSRIDVSPEIVPARRGHLRLTGTTIARPDPFGLFKACVTLPAPGSVLVLPKRYPLPRLALPGRRRYQRGGVSLATSVGDSEEFAALRDYRPGDALRRVHWRSWARLGKPIVKEYQDEFFVRHALILDTFVGTSGRGTGDDGAAGRRAVAFEEAVSVAASFACAIETQESLLDLLFVGPEAYAFTAGRGVAHTERMLEILACVRACTTRPFGALHRLVLDRQSGLAGAVCVLLGWDAERRGLVADLEAHGIPVLAVVVSGDAPPGDAAGPAPSGGLHFAPPGRVAEGLARL